MLNSEPLKDCLNILFSNFRSLKNKLPELKATIEALNLDIVIANESWLDSSVPINFLNIFEIHRKDRLCRGGGVFIAIKNSYNSIRKIDFECGDLENICVEVQLNSSKILFITVYLPPPVNHYQYKMVDEILSKIE